MSRLPLVLMFLACVSCSKKKPAATTGSAGSAATAEGSGSAAEMTGSAGSAGSAMMAGSGSAEGSGSAAMAGSGSAAMAGSGSGAEEADEAKNPGFDFDKLTRDDKIKFMKEKVVPTMKPVFQKFDAKRYKDFGCKTCHGKNAKARKYKMPTPELPKLDFAKLKAGKQKPKVAEWMNKVVKPDMAKLLNMPEMTETNPKGFGCLDCHEQKK